MESSTCKIPTSLYEIKGVAHYELLHEQNKCLQLQIDELYSTVSKKSSEIDKLTLEISNIKGSSAEFNKGQEAKFELFAETHQTSLNHNHALFEKTLNVFDSWATFLTILIALAGAVTFFLIKTYKQREVQEVIDNAVSEAERKLEDSALLKSAIINALGDEDSKVHISSILSELIDELGIKDNDDNKACPNEVKAFNDVLDVGDSKP